MAYVNEVTKKYFLSLKPEQLGINKVYNDTKNTIDNKMNEYGIKEKMAKGLLFFYI